MTLAAIIFGPEIRLRPLIKSFALATAARAGWLLISAYRPSAAAMAWALVPWPHQAFSWTGLVVELALLFYQLRAGIRLTRLLVLRFAPDAAGFLGFSPSPPETSTPLTPRHRSWWPTALLLCGIVMLSCCAVTWLVLMFSYGQWASFDGFMATHYADKPLLVGLVLSILGLMFGGRYVARAAGDVTTSFGVVTVDGSHWLTGRVHELADRLNLPRPAVGVTDIMNAFAMGAKQKASMVVIGKPLFAFEKDEIDAIIGHELGHILHNDVARMQFAEGFQRALVTVINVLTVLGAFTAAVRSKKRSLAIRNFRLAMGSGRLVRSTVFVASELVAKGISRNREFHADAVGAHLTSPDAMARALKRVHGVSHLPTPEERHYGYLMFRGATLGNLFATHPPLKARLKALGTFPVPQAAASVPVFQTFTGTPEASLGVAPTVLVSSDAAPAPSPAPADSIAKTLSPWIRRLLVYVRGQVNARQLATFGAAGLLLVVVAPAIINFYGLERRFDDVTTATGQRLESSWNRVVQTKDEWRGDARLSGALAERDQARRQVQDLLTKLDTANAERTVLTARLAKLNTTASATQADSGQADLQRQVASLTQQLSSTTADRDDMARRNDELQKRNAELQGQIAERDTARVDLDKQIQGFQNQIASLLGGRPAGQDAALPLVRPMPSGAQGGYGAFAVASNGIVILTDHGFETEQDAIDAVLAECGQFSGGSPCQVKRTFRNTCAAVARVIPATRKSRYELQLEPTIRDARDSALSECFFRNHRPCEVTRQVCVQ